MQFNFPPQLTYNQLQTKAFFSVYKSWPIQPISNGGQYWPGQVIRIFLNALTDGVMDPYRSHIEITVETDENLLPVGLLQVDNSAQSFIQQLVINSKNRQIQRIIQYGALAAYLTDVGISQLYAQGKQTEGLGYSNIDNYSHMYNQSLNSAFSSFTDFNYGNQNKVISSPATCFPTIPSKYIYGTSWGDQWGGFSQLQFGFRSHLNQYNSAWLSHTQPAWWNIYIGIQNPNVTNRMSNLFLYGYMHNIRAQYLANYYSNNYVDSVDSLSKYQIRLQNDVQKGLFPSYFNNQTIYRTYIPQQIKYMTNNWNTSSGSSNFMVPNIPSINGFTTLYSPQFAKGVRQPFISPTVPQIGIMNGKIISQKLPLFRRTFKIPIISAILGLLIPQNQFVLLPLRALNDVLIQMTIDQAAMFTSGYNDISEYDYVGMGLMQKRNFKLTRLVYNLCTYQFYTTQMDQYLTVSLTSGIAINTQFWQLGNQYQVQNSQSLTNSWPVACNQQALNQILVLFYPLDYQNFTFCRKHFRISNNITKMQLRINMQYYPSQPITGNGGCPVAIDSSGDNSVFLQQIFYTNGYMFSNLSPMPRINAYNFSINDRCYNIYNTNPLYDIAMYNNSNYKWNGHTVNTDTAMGMANLHQNRFVGKAAYVYSFQPYSHSSNFLTGIDTRKAKQFDIIFGCNPQNWFPRPQMMLIYTRSSVIIQYTRDGIINMNKR